MKTILKIFILSFFILNISCTEKVKDTPIETVEETTPTVEIVDWNVKVKETLSKQTPSFIHKIDATHQIVLPYYYSDIEIYETSYLSDPWDIEILERFEEIEEPIIEVAFNGFLESHFGAKEDLVIINNIDEGIISIEDIKKERMLYNEDATIIYENNNSFILIVDRDEMVIHHILYDRLNKSSLLYTGTITSINDLPLESNKELSLELLKTAENLNNVSLLNIDHTFKTINDYKRIQSQVITDKITSIFKPASKQIKLFMDEEEVISIGTKYNNNLLKVLKANTESASKIDKLLYAIETNNLEEIFSSMDNLSNSDRSFLKIPYDRDNLIIQHTKDLYTYTITMTHIDFTDEVINNIINIGILTTNTGEYYILKMDSDNLIQADYYTKLLNHFIKSNSL